MTKKIYSNAQWERLVESTVEKIKNLAQTKGEEYSGDLDRLDNFRRNGAQLGMEQEAVLGVYAGKHWDAIQTYIRDINAGRTRQRSEPIAGRVDDLIVYMLLFKAMLEERENEKLSVGPAKGPGPQPTLIEKCELTPCKSCGSKTFIWTQQHDANWPSPRTAQICASCGAVQ